MRQNEWKENIQNKLWNKSWKKSIPEGHKIKAESISPKNYHINEIKREKKRGRDGDNGSVGGDKGGGSGGGGNEGCSKGKWRWWLWRGGGSSKARNLLEKMQMI